MGLLGELAAEASLFEPFRNTPSLAWVRRCLSKQLTWHHELERRARVPPSKAAESVDAAPPAAVAFPWLVVIGPGRPETVLDLYGCAQVLPGVYEAVPGLRMRVVVLVELPRTRETLLLRLLGAGRLLREALADLAALATDAWERSVAVPALIHFGLASGGELGDDEEVEMSSEIQAWYKEYEANQQRLRAEAHDEGRAEEAARALTTVLRARGIAVPDAVRGRILAEKSPERLERWLEKAAVAASIADVIDDPS